MVYRKKFGWIPAALVVIVLVFSISLMAIILKHSNELREFDVDMFVLCGESDICIGESVNGRVRVSKDNLTALHAIMADMKGSITVGNPAASENMVFRFDCHDEEWDFTVEKITEDKLRITLNGPRKYRLYIKNGGKYEDLLKVVSPDGYNTPNKAM